MNRKKVGKFVIFCLCLMVGFLILRERPAHAAERIKRIGTFIAEREAGRTRYYFNTTFGEYVRLARNRQLSRMALCPDGESAYFYIEGIPVYSWDGTLVEIKVRYYRKLKECVQPGPLYQFEYNRPMRYYERDRRDYCNCGIPAMGTGRDDWKKKCSCTCE